MSFVACPKVRPHESRPSPSRTRATANRCPSRTVWGTVNSESSYFTCVPASILRVAIATLSPGAGRRPTSSNVSRSLPAIKDHPPVVPDRARLRSQCIVACARGTACATDGSWLAWSPAARAARRTFGIGAGCRRGPCSRPTRAPGNRRSSRSARASPPGRRPGRRGTPPPPRGWPASHLPAVRRSPSRSEEHLHLAAFDDYVVAAQVDVRVGQASPGRHVVLEAVPGAYDDLAVVDPLEPPVVLGPGNEGAQRRLALAEGTGLVRADVWQAVELAADVENPYLAPPDPHYPVAPLREVRDGADDVRFAFLLTLRHPSPWRFRRLPLASMLKSLSAFSPKTLRRTSLVKGTWCTLAGWSKSWCGQSEAKMVLSSPS